MYKYLNNVTNISKYIMTNIVREGSFVIDATVGNGNDTITLAELVGNSGKVYGFDIQDKAIENTKEKLLLKSLTNRVELIKDSHENINKYIREPVNLVVFNLGYLPNGDHSIVTKSASTILAIKESLKILKPNGLLVITSYPGHIEGKKEKEDIENLLKSIEQKNFNVLKFDFINQINNPPILYAIEKKAEKEWDNE